MTKFFNIFKKPCFGSIFGPIFQFWDKKNFYGNSGSVTHNSYGFLAPCQNLEKTRYNSRKTPGQRDGQGIDMTSIEALLVSLLLTLKVFRKTLTTLL